jgi:tripartite ATP-independent transporter DctP family solute receptor
VTTTEPTHRRLTPLWLALPLLLIGYALLRYVADPSARYTVLRLAHALNAAHPVHHGMQVFGTELERLSDGRLRVEIYADGKLGTERELVEQLQIGSIALTKVSAGQLEAFAPSYRVFGLPYLFDDSAHFWRFAATPTAQTLLTSSQPQRIMGLSFFDAGARSFYLTARSGREVRTPADLRGLNLRVMPSASAMAMVQALGAKPVPIPFGELYSALDSGTVDGAENNPPSLFSSRQFEVARSFSLNEHLILPDVLVIGTPTWDRLSAQEQTWVQRAAIVASQAQRAAWRSEEARNLAAMRAAGLKIIEDIDKQPFRNATAALRAEIERTPSAAIDLLKAIEFTREVPP